MSGYSVTKRLTVIAVLAAIYFGSAQLGLSLASAHRNVSLIWPSTGIALAAVLLLGYWVWPAVALGAFLANAATGLSLFTAGGIAVGNTLEALGGAFLVRRLIGYRNPLDQAQDIFRFVGSAVLLSTIVSATIGTASLCLGMAASWSDYEQLWLAWWLGDAAGALVVTPAVLAWNVRRKIAREPRQVAEVALLLVLLTLVSYTVFAGWISRGVANLSLVYLPVPFLIWAAVRFHQRTVTTAILLTSGIAIWGTAHGLGPFARGTTLNESLFLLHTFVGITAVMSLVMAAVVAERKQAEVTQRSSQEQYKLLVEQARDIIYRADAQGRFTFVNPTASRIMGYSEQELLGRRFLELIRPDAREAAERFYGRQLVRKTPTTYYEFPAIAKDGKEIWFGQNVQVLLENGQVVGVHAMARDITDRKRAEEALRESEAFKNRILESSPDCIKVLDLEGRLLFMNKGGQELMEIRDIALLLNSQWFEFWKGEDKEGGRAAIEAARTGNAGRFVGFCPTATGKPKWWDVFITPLFDASGTPDRLLAISRDITERKREEKILQALLEGTASVTGKQFFPALVRVLARALGVRHAFVTELLGDEQPRLRILAIWTGDRLGNPTEYDLARTPCENVIKLGEAYYQHSVQELFPEDKDLVAFGAVSYLGIALADSSGKTIGHLCILDDKPLPDEHHITPLLKVFASRAAAELERKQMEEALRMRARVLESMLEGVSLSDENGVIRHTNPAEDAMFGYEPGELIGKHVTVLNAYPPDENARIVEGVIEQLKVKGSWEGEFNNRRKDGTPFITFARITALELQGKKYWVCVQENITARRWAEEVQEQLVAELAESRNRFEMFFRRTPSAISITTVKEGRFIDVNEQAEVLTGYSREELIGRTTLEMNLYVDPTDRAGIVQRLNETGVLTDVERQIRTKSGEIRTAVFSLVPIQMGSEPCLLSIAHDITERKRAESLLAGEKCVLEMISSDATLSTVLESIARMVEEQRPGTLCSILLLDKSRKTLYHGAAPSLPPSYIQSVDGIAIGPTAGSCGTAAFLEKTVIVSDISSDPLWATCRELALPHGLQACWSVPILSSDRLVLGTFAQYHRVPRSPTDDDLRLVERFCDLAGIAIERAQAEDVLRNANQALRTLSRQLLQVQEDDRRAIARDLHDEIGQSLTAIKLNVERAQRTSDRAARDAIMKDCLQITDGVLNQVRTLSLDLHPSILDDLGLAYALKWYADRQAERAGLKIEVAADLSLPRLSPDIEIGCFRIAQEALTNVVRHAKASRASVTLKRGTTTMELRVQDDGIGFVVDTVPSAAAGATSVGLASMQERARLLGGEVTVKSVLGQGTEVVAMLPLPLTSSAETPATEASRS